MNAEQQAYWDRLMRMNLERAKEQFAKQEAEYARCVRRAEMIAFEYAKRTDPFLSNQ